MSNNPPFYIGQKVVAIRNHSQAIFKIGDRFSVTGIYPSKCLCSGWDITIGIAWTYPNWVYDCGGCGAIDIPCTSKERLFDYKDFAPIEPLYNDVTAELAGKAITEEVPDLIKPLIHQS